MKKMKTILPAFVSGWMYRKGLFPEYKPVPGKVHFGDLLRTEPLSREFGYDRGGPVDRYYIENFLSENSVFIKGRVLEIGDNSYTLRFGGQQVKQSDILHVNESNPKATFIGDLSNAPHIPSDSFDCIILTQTLHLIYDYRDALQTCHRILKPGGALLLTVPGITHIDHNEWGKTWYWSFTGKAIHRMMAEVFPAQNIIVQTYGNVLVCSAFLYGLSMKEVNKKTLDEHDPDYQLVITVKAVK